MRRFSATSCSRAAAAFATLLLAGGCAIVEPELPYILPEEDQSTDPQALRPGEFAYPCSRWRDGVRPAADYLLVDIFFHVSFGPTPNAAQPLLYHRRLVERFGGVILRSYHLAGMRVWLPTDAVPLLEPEGTVHSVPDPRRYDVFAYIRFRTVADFPRISALVTALGGKVVGAPEGLPNAPPEGIILIPNRGIPRLRALPEMESLAYSGIPFCL